LEAIAADQRECNTLAVYAPKLQCAGGIFVQGPAVVAKAQPGIGAPTRLESRVVLGHEPQTRLSDHSFKFADYSFFDSWHHAAHPAGGEALVCGARGGVVVNVSSIAATLGAPREYVHYAASKAAVEAFTVGLAKEVADNGTRIKAVCPDTTLTDSHAEAGELGRPQRVAARIPMRRQAKRPRLRRPSYGCSPITLRT
jgi:NAD(P)-dependent dehydrogenase (short-subunit alcohol dehydrogenase family)